MKSYRARTGPLLERPYYSLQEIEDICTDALRTVGLYPETPQPVRIERFVEKRFGVHPEYLELPDGLLGYTKFGSKGVEQIVVSRRLMEQGSRVAERQANSTLAHEAGHGLLQAHLFALESDRLTSLFGEEFDPQVPKILCRTPTLAKEKTRGRYDGKWWEFQANRAIGGLLLPRPLALQAIAALVTTAGRLGMQTLTPGNRATAVETLVECFEVNPAAARVRLEELFPENAADQLTL